MPNWVQNNVEITVKTKQRAEEIKKALKGECGAFDFNKIIPMPPHSDTFYAKGGFGIKEEQKYGKNNWYDWSIKNWGTKWNSHNVDVQVYKNILTYHFETAWATPYPIFRELAKKFNCVVNVEFYDQDDFGYNCGNIQCFPDGKCNVTGHAEDWNWFEDIFGADYLIDYGLEKGESGWKYVGL